ncbi:unnamed protein product, partial [Polarella glacialis]
VQLGTQRLAQFVGLEPHPSLHERAQARLRGLLEAHPDKAAETRVALIKAAALDVSGRAPFFANLPSGAGLDAGHPLWGVDSSSSLLRPAQVSGSQEVYQRYAQETLEVTTVRLDELAVQFEFRAIDVLQLDCEGVELKALAGAGRLLQEVSLVQVEGYNEEAAEARHEGMETAAQKRAWLEAHNFTLLFEMVDDAVYLRNDLLPLLLPEKRQRSHAI